MLGRWQLKTVLTGDGKERGRERRYQGENQGGRRKRDSLTGLVSVFVCVCVCEGGKVRGGGRGEREIAR